MSAPESRNGLVTSTKTPLRPSLASDPSVSSIKSNFEELSIFDNDSTGEDTPITPPYTPNVEYFPSVKGKKDDLRRQLWAGKGKGKNTKGGESSASSMLVVPNPAQRARASSAPEGRSAIDINEPDEAIEDLIRDMGNMDLGKVGVNSPSKQLPSEWRGRQRYTEMQLLGDELGRRHVPLTKKVRTPQDVDKPSRNTQEGQGLKVLLRPGCGHSSQDLASKQSQSEPLVSESPSRSSPMDVDAPVLPIGAFQDRIEETNSKPAANVIVDTTSDSESTPETKSTASSNDPSDGPQSNSETIKEGPESTHLDTPSDPVVPEPDSATSSASKIPKAQKSTPPQNTAPGKDSAVSFPDLEHFYSIPKPKAKIKTEILHTLRRRTLDPKPNPTPNKKIGGKDGATANENTVAKAGTEAKPAKVKQPYESRAGYVYIFTSPSYPKYFKIGKTKQKPGERVAQWSTKCNFVANHISDPNDQCFPYYDIVETLVHLELSNERRTFKCEICKSGHRLKLSDCKGKKNVDRETSAEKGERATEHGEWFEITQERALAVVQRWRKWVVDNEPYWKDGSLRDKWIWKENQAQRSVEMRWMRWLQKKLPKRFQRPESVERDWDWDRWVQMRWDDSFCYLLYRLDLELKSIWRPVMNLLRHPGLFVWVLVGSALMLAYSACGGGTWGWCASFGVMCAILALWMHFGC
jgi:hypothetical protein